MARKVEVEPVLDNGNQWQEEEGEVVEKRSGKRKVDLFEKGGGGISGGETGSSPRSAAGVSNKSRN